MPQVSLDALVTAAQTGQLISFPTDTVPALAAQPHQAAKIFQAKGRSQQKPLILMAATAADLWPFAVADADADHQWQQMAARYWPGAVTLVLPASSQVPPTVNPNTHTIGLRVPDWPLAQAILAQTGPLATTSINRSGQAPLLSSDAIATQFPQVFTPQQWQSPHQATETAPSPSTVIQWQQSQWHILRQGAVTLPELRAIDRQ